MTEVREYFSGTTRFRSILIASVENDHIDIDGFDVQRVSGANLDSKGQTYPWSIQVTGPGGYNERIDGSWSYKTTNSYRKRIASDRHFRRLAAGEYTIRASVSMNFGSPLGTRTSTPEMKVTVGGVPRKPVKPIWTNITRNSGRLTWRQPDTNLSPITGYDVQFGTNMTEYQTKSTNADARFLDFGELRPDTQYYGRVRGKNKIGLGAWSDWVVFKTTTALGPTIGVSPSWSGETADVVISPGTTVGSVTQWRVEITIDYPPMMNPPKQRWVNVPLDGKATVTGLIRNARYRWRAQAKFADGTYGPWSAPILVLQPGPSLPRGQFFHGGFASLNEGDMQFAWTGITDLSMSQASAPIPEGWGAFPTGTAAKGSLGVLFSIRGGYVGSRSVRALFWRSATARGVRFLLDPVPLDPAAGRYWGSIRVRSSRVKKFVGVLVWMNDANAVVATTVGTLVRPTPRTDGFYTVWFNGEKPEGATKVALGVEDAADATSNGIWQAGDALDMDGAALFYRQDYDYFDGSTPDTGRGYRYGWLGEAHASRSFREESEINYAAILDDPDCVQIPLPPRPPAVQMDCIEDVGLWSRYWARVAPESGAWVDAVPTVWVEALQAAERQVRVRWFRIEGSYQPVYGEWETTWVNTFPNPSLTTIDASSATLAKNLLKGPYPVEGDESWKPGAYGSGVYYSFAVDETVLSPTRGLPTARVSRPTAGSFSLDVIGEILGIGWGAQADRAAGAMPVEPGKQYTIAFAYRSSYVDPKVRLDLVYQFSDGVGIGASETRQLVLPADTFTVISYTTAPIPAGVSNISLNAATLTRDGSAAPLNVPTWIGEAIGVEGTEPADYFDGNGGPEDDSEYIYEWAGEIAASESLRKGGSPLGVSQGGTSPMAFWSSRAWSEEIDGSSVRLRPLSSGTDTAITVGGNSMTGMNAGIEPGLPFTVLAAFHQDAPQTGTLNETIARRIIVAYNTVPGAAGATLITSDPAPNEAGSTLLRLTATVPADAVWAQVRLGHGGALGSGDVWYDQIATIPGIFEGDWFDGSSYDLLEPDTVRTLWEGEPDQSASLYQERSRVEEWMEPPVEQVDPDAFIAEQVISYLPVGGTLVLDGIDRHAWFDMPDGRSIPADHLLAGSSGRPPSWPTLSCTVAYYLTIDVPLDSPGGNLRITQATTAVVA